MIKFIEQPLFSSQEISQGKSAALISSQNKEMQSTLHYPHELYFIEQKFIPISSKLNPVKNGIRMIDVSASKPQEISFDFNYLFDFTELRNNKCRLRQIWYSRYFVDLYSDAYRRIFSLFDGLDSTYFIRYISISSLSIESFWLFDPEDPNGNLYLPILPPGPNLQMEFISEEQFIVLINNSPRSNNKNLGE